MPRSHEYLTLLEKHQIPLTASDETILATVRHRLSLFPADLEPVLLVYGHIPQTFEEFNSVITLLQLVQHNGQSLKEALNQVSALGKQHSQSTQAR